MEPGAYVGVVLQAFFVTAFVMNILFFFHYVYKFYRNERQWNKNQSSKEGRRSIYFKAKQESQKVAEKLVKKEEKVLV